MSLRRITAGVSVLMILAACGTAAPAGSTPPTGTPGSGASASSGAATASGVASPPASVPGASLGGFINDPDLAAKFPTQVGGKPLSSVTTSKLADFLTAFGTTPAQIEQTRQTLSGVGIDLNAVLFGTATATINGSPQGFSAIRVPGQDASKLIPIYALFTASNEGDKVTQETSGGKSVSVVRSANGYASTWMYASGDILWTVDTSDEKEAAAIFSAIQ